MDVLPVAIGISALVVATTSLVFTVLQWRERRSERAVAEVQRSLPLELALIGANWGTTDKGMDEPLQMIEIGVEISNPAITGNSVTQAKLSLGNGDSRQEFISSGNDTLTGMVRHAPEGPRHRPTDLPVNVRSHGAHRAWFYFRVDPELDLVRSAALLTLVDVRQGSYNLEIDLSACGQ